ncbi:MAG: ArsR/SmtB family transcription factor [Solirubrobacteraceae bacterium]
MSSLADRAHAEPARPSALEPAAPAPVAAGLVPAPHTPGLADVLRALSDPIRLRIVHQLADGEEHTCGSFALPITKSTCSHHFRVLREAGVIAQRIDGKNHFNRLERSCLEERFPGLLDAVLRARDS